jgi:hypothetical protein
MNDRVESGGATPFLPTLDRARSEGYVPLGSDGREVALLQGEPLIHRRLAALVVRARVVRREVREDQVEMSLERAAALRRDMPPLPKVFASQSYVVRLRRENGEGRACTSCDLRRAGYTACHLCGGSGALPPERRCPACFNGFIVCAGCDGSRVTLAVDLRRVDDVDLALRDTFVPDAFRYVPGLFNVPRFLRELLEPVDPPMALAFPLVSRPQGSAYRDAVRREPEVVFHGHRFEDALETARLGLRAMMKPKTEAVLFDVRSFAWPFLWVELASDGTKQEAVLVVRPDGRLGGYVSSKS